MKNKKKLWDFVTYFVIVLIVSLPIYSADALAVSVQVTKNTGNDNLPGYVNALGDTWQVEAVVSGTDIVDVSDVKIKLDNYEGKFDSCSSGISGSVCTYQSVFEEEIPEDIHLFKVIYSDSEGNYGESVSKELYADGSPPKIDGFVARQLGSGEIKVNFNVKDLGNSAVGLKKVELIDADTNNILESFTYTYADDMFEFNYEDESQYAGILTEFLNGVEGIKKIKVVAEDLLGHQETKTKQFSVDTTKPEISNTINFTEFGDFIGTSIMTTDIVVDIEEKNFENYEVKAYSEQAELDGNFADCVEDDNINNLYHCVWRDINVYSENSVAVRVVAIDDKGNVAEKTITKTFTIDDSPPVLEFFGTEYTYKGNSYVKNGENKIIALISEVGAGIDENNIKANLRGFGQGVEESPNDCETIDGILKCSWNVRLSSSSGNKVSVSLSQFNDNAGNVGEAGEIDLIIDNDKPIVKNLVIKGVSSIGENTFFQSHDKIKIQMEVEESAGVIILVNFNNLVSDALNNYEETDLAPAGWKIFSDNCDRNSENWYCVVETDEIKGGPDNNVPLEIVVLDTAGNEVTDWSSDVPSGIEGSDGSYTFDLLGIEDDENPDYWEVKNVETMASFVDLEVTELIPARIPVKIKLKSTVRDVRLLKAEIIGCSPYSDEGEDNVIPAPDFNRNPLLYGGSTFSSGNNPNLNLLLEFAPFNGKQFFGLDEIEQGEKFKTINVKYLCKLKIYSSFGDNILNSAEIQEVVLEVPFGFSSLGAIDENLKERIDGIKHSVSFEIADNLKILAEIVQWLDFFNRLISIINKADITFSLLMVASDSAKIAEVITLTPVPIAESFCTVGVNTQGAISKFLSESGVQTPLSIGLSVLSCQPNPSQLSWYGQYQQNILNIYNGFSGRILLGLPATSLRENLISSLIGGCVPGIVENLEELRQVKCRTMLCLQNEVPAGIATVGSCYKLDKYLTCRYVTGDLLDMAFVFNPIDQVVSFLKAFLTNPLGFIDLGLHSLCQGFCLADSGSAAAVCTWTTLINNIFGLADSITGGLQTLPPKVNNPYCSQIDDLDETSLFDNLLSGADFNKPEKPESVTVDDVNNGNTGGTGNNPASSPGTTTPGSNLGEI